jgi:hypothetical protein
MTSLLTTKCLYFHSFNQDRINRRNENFEEDSSNYPEFFSECVKKESITPPGSIKSINTNSNSKNDTESVTKVFQLKTEPLGTPDSPESSSIENLQTLSTADDCAGCGRLIQVSLL